MCIEFLLRRRGQFKEAQRISLLLLEVLFSHGSQ